MEILVYVLLILSAAALVCSVVLTVNMFKCFAGSQDTQQDAKHTKDDLIKYRNRMIISYAAAVLLITAAAVVKLIVK